MTPSERAAERLGWQCCGRGEEAWWIHPVYGTIEKRRRWWSWRPANGARSRRFDTLHAAVKVATGGTAVTP